MPVIAAYREALSRIRGSAHGMDGTQAGDPVKATVARALKAERTPLRLVLRADAVDAVRVRAQALLTEIAEWDDVSRATALDPPAGHVATMSGRMTRS